MTRIRAHAEHGAPDLTDGSQDSDAPILAQTIKSHLDNLVVGQNSAKIQVSMLLSMHLSWFRDEQRSHPAPKAIIIGPTGVGKTHSLRVATQYLGIPYIVVDATSLVPSGIAGLQIEDLLEDLVRSAHTINLNKARIAGGDVASLFASEDSDLTDKDDLNPELVHLIG